MNPSAKANSHRDQPKREWRDDMNEDRREDIGDDVQDDAVIGRALRWSLLVFLVLAAMVGGSMYALLRTPPPPPPKETKLAGTRLREVARIRIPELPFTDITRGAGIDFRHDNGARGRKLLPETMGGGCAFFDFDGDQDQDILLVNSRAWPWDADRATAPPATMALYRNDGAGNFANVTAGSGLDVSLYGMGVAVGDYDNDGRRDVFVSALGSNRLFRNLGNGQFRDVTEDAGVAGAADEWSSSCGWFDYDNDGDLDLFVGNYVKWSREYDESQGFQLTGGGRAYGRPQNFEGTFPYLYRNDGDGKFVDVSAPAGIQVRNPATGVPMAKTLGVTFADCDEDGWIDILIANDTVQNFLFRNQGDGTFREMGAVSGVAFDMNGNALGAMGIDAARFRAGEAFGVVIGNFANEMTSLYVAYGSEMHFMDEAIASGLGPNTRLELTFGVFYFDCDLDGRLDLFAANGHLEEDINRVQPSQTYEQAPQMFWNCGSRYDTEFVPVPESLCGADLIEPLVGRGAAYADIDNDGDQDVLIATTGQSPRLLRNDQELKHHWLRLQLSGARCNRDAIGAWVYVELEDRVLRRQVMPTRGYLSQVELPLTFGLGDASRAERVTIHWPDGTTQSLTDLEADRSYEVEQDVSSEL